MQSIIARLNRRVDGNSYWLSRLTVVLRRWPDAKLLALVDQGIVSATSFLTSLLIGRYAGASQLGLYAIGVSVLASVFTLHGALLAQPYAVHRHRPTGTAAEHAGGTLTLCALLSLGTALLLALIAVVMLAVGSSRELAVALLAFTAIIPFATARDFYRRFGYARMEVARVLALDANVAFIQLLALAWLAWAGRLSAESAFSVIGISCGIAAILFLHGIQSKLAVRLSQLRALIRRSWKLGKWLVVSQIMIQIQGFVTYWLCMAIAGAEATGVYAACMTIISVTNPLVNGLGNLMLPKLVLAWTQHGAVGLRRKAIQDALLLGAVMAPLCLFVLVAGQDVLHLLYPGNEYRGYGNITVVLAFATLVAAVGLPPLYALTSMEKPRSVLIVNSVGALLTVVLVSTLTMTFGVLGAAYGWLIGNVVVTGGLWRRLLFSISKSDNVANPAEVLHDINCFLNPRDVEVECLGEGGESHIYGVRSLRETPIIGEHRHVVLKIYKTSEPVTLGEVEAQFAALARLNRDIGDLAVGQWIAAAPKPLRICEKPLALVMTAVPGSKELKAGMASDANLTSGVLVELAQTFVAAMQQLWSRGSTHGDLGLQNILYDLQSKSLSFIDPGTDGFCAVCTDLGGAAHPAALELGHLIRDFGTDVKDLTGNRAARARREIFVENAVRAYLATLNSPEEKRRTLDAIRTSAITHLECVLRQPLFSIPLFQRLIACFVVRRMNTLLSRIEID